MAIKYFTLIVQSLFSINMNHCNNGPDTNKITIIGTAIVIKNHAAVRTDDSLLYYLYGISNWDVEYKGNRVKVIGKLFKLGPPATKNPNPEITAYPQPRLRDGRYLKNAKWKLVE